MESSAKRKLVLGLVTMGGAAALFAPIGCSTTSVPPASTATKTQRPHTSTPTPSSTPSFPSPTPWSTPASSYVVVIGGSTNSPGWFSDTLVAPIQSGGTLGAWVMSPNPIPSPMFAPGGTAGVNPIVTAMWSVKSVQSGSAPSFIYGNPAEPTAGGAIFSDFLAWAPSTGSASTGVGPWIEGTPIGNAAATATPILVVWGSAVTDNSFIYTVDSFAGTGNTAYVQMTAGGVTQPWTIDTDAIGVDLDNFPMVEGNGYLFTLAGRTGGTAIIADIYRAQVPSPGNPGAWSSVGQMPYSVRRNPHGAVSVPLPSGVWVYFAGGFDGNGATISTVLRASIDAFGNLGSWQTAASMPGAGEYGNLISYKSGAAFYLAYIGGRDVAQVESASVYYVPINADGSLGTWATTSSLPTPRYMVAAEVF